MVRVKVPDPAGKGEKAIAFPAGDEISVDSHNNLHVFAAGKRIGVLAAEQWLAADVGYAHPAQVKAIKGSNE